MNGMWEAFHKTFLILDQTEQCLFSILCHSMPTQFISTEWIRVCFYVKRDRAWQKSPSVWNEKANEQQCRCTFPTCAHLIRAGTRPERRKAIPPSVRAHLSDGKLKTRCAKQDRTRGKAAFLAAKKTADAKKKIRYSQAACNFCASKTLCGCTKL